MGNASDLKTASSWGSFATIWDNTVRHHGKSDFLHFKRDEEYASWSYEEFDRLVDLTVATLISYGLTRGSAIHVCLRNCPGFIAIWLAAARMGAWFVPVDPGSSAQDIAKQIRKTSPSLGICGQARADVYRRGTRDSSVRVIELPESAADLDEDSPLLLAIGKQEQKETPGPKERLSVMFTSGTTSEPKGVELTQANYACVGQVMAAAAELKSDHRWFVTLPLFHANAQFYCFAPAIVVGASVALTAEFSASRWVAQSLEMEATHASLFASPMRMILARTPEDQPRGKLEHVWFAQNLAEGHYREFTDLVGCTPRQLYGMTETVAVVTRDDRPVPTSDVIGTVLPSRWAKLINTDTYRRVPNGTPGLIAVAGERGEDLFAGYLDSPDITAESFFKDESGVEWFLTGDLAVENESGSWSFVGRVDDVIKVAGENVSLTEVEAAVAEAPGVLEAAVVAVADEIRDTVPIAYVVPRGGTVSTSVEELQQWAAQHLAPSKRPREWHILRELPRTSVGKIRRFKLTQGRA